MNEWEQQVAFGAICLTLKGQRRGHLGDYEWTGPGQGKTNRDRTVGVDSSLESAPLVFVFGGGFFFTPGPAYKNGKLNGFQVGGDKIFQSSAVVMHKDLNG